jgi:IS5 family transposase
VSLVAGDLRREGVRQTGRRGLPAETVLRCAPLKQQRQLSYEELAFHLEDSASFPAFARLPLAWSPKKSVLHRTISTIRAATWEAINRALIAAVDAARAALQRAADRVAELAGSAAERWRAEVSHYLPLIARVIDQSERRVLHGQAVPANEKLVSLFEPHADIIVKGARDVQYGHKINLVTGKSGLILDIVIEAGNPADAERFLPMLDRHIARCGTPPRQIAADGGYASRDNLTEAKGRGVTDVAFHKKRGLAVADMTKSAWVYRKLPTSAPASRPASPA